jgi:hypothetical protein
MGIMAKYNVEYRPQKDDRGISAYAFVGCLAKGSPRLFQLRKSSTAMMRVEYTRVNGQEIPDAVRLYSNLPFRLEFLVREDVTENDFILIELV